MNFVCPKCALPLTVCEGGAAKCPAGHSYDRARAGYYNLLLGSGGGTHGDNAEMVEARRAFLDTGAYRPLADKVAELLLKYMRGTRLLDIGCGEGYYTDAILGAFAKEGRELSVSGFDISRDAVKLAARRNKSLELAVASAYRMPVADGSFDGALNMFSPLAPSEILRALAPEGVFVMAIPAEDHLFGLKRAAYKTPYKNEVSDPALDGFRLLCTERVSYTLKLHGAEISSLFAMTPYFYRTPPEDKARVMAMTELTTDVDFLIFVYKRS